MRRGGSWIKCCILTARFSVLMSGSPIDFFNNFQGLRQGQPLSPFLFVIAMEALNRMISAIVNNGFMAGFSVGGTNRGTLNISHLLFADDTSIFCEEEQNQI